MKFKNLVIESYAYSLSEEIMTSTDIEEKLAPLYEKLKLPEEQRKLLNRDTFIASKEIFITNKMNSLIDLDIKKVLDDLKKDKYSFWFDAVE